MAEHDTPPPTITAMKIPIIKKGEYDIWSMRMCQYICHTNHNIWDVIINRDQDDEPAPTRDQAGPAAPPPPKTEAIKSRFGGNEESKKMQKNVIKHQFENFTTAPNGSLDKAYNRFQKLISQMEVYGAQILKEDINQKFLRSLPSAWSQISLIMRNKSDIDQVDIDDLYNNLRNTSSTNEVNTASGSFGVSTAAGTSQASPTPSTDIGQDDLEELDIRWQVAMLTLRVQKFVKRTGRNLNFNGKQSVSLDKSKIECYNFHRKGHFAKECNYKRNQGKRPYDDNGRRNAASNESSSQALVAQDGLGGYDWSNDFEIEPVNYAFMAISSSSSSSSNNEVQTCSKKCLESFKILQKNYDTEREKHTRGRLEIQGYEIALESLESRILGHERNEIAWGEKYEFQNYELNEISLSVFDVRSSDEESTTANAGFLKQWMNIRDDETTPANDRFSKNEFHVVPPPITGNFLTPRADISFAGLDEYAIRNKIIESKTTEPNTKTSKTVGKSNDASTEKPKFVSESVVNKDRVIIEDWTSDDEEDVSVFNSVETNKIQTVNNKVHKIGQKQGIGFKKTKACFVCKSTDHLIKDCNFYDKKGQEPKKKNVVKTGPRVDKPVWDNAKRVNHQNFSNTLKYPHLRETFVPSGVLTRTCLVHTTKHVSTVKPSVSTDRPNVNTGRPKDNHVRPISPTRPNVRPFVLQIAQTGGAIRLIYPRMDNVRPRAPCSKNLKQVDKTSGVNNMATNEKRAVVNAAKGKLANTQKGTKWVWKPKGNYLDHMSKDSGSFMLKKFEYGNPEIFLQDHAVVDSGCSSHMTGNKAYLSDYEDYNGDELNFKLLDESQVVLRAPRKDDVYSLDLKNIVPSGGITCLYANATPDESKLWHMRLGHVNFKNINKLVKGNPVRGLPSKVFVNDHTCVACKKGKQHKASLDNINKKRFLIGLENQLNHKVKIIRCDNGTEFKNKTTNEFCAKKGIKREFSVARTPQQNGLAERKNRTLIEAARTMLADSLLPIPFWAEAVNPACYFDGKSDEGYLLGHYLIKVICLDTLPFVKPLEYTTKGQKGFIMKRINEPTHEYLLYYPLTTCIGQGFHTRMLFRTKNHMPEDRKKVVKIEMETMVTQKNGAKAMDDVSRQALKEEKEENCNLKRRASSNANASESSFVYLRGKIPIDASTLLNADLPIDPNMPDLEDASDTLPNDGIFNEAYDDEDDKFLADLALEVQTRGRFKRPSLVKQQPDGIFISQDKYVVDMLMKFDFWSIRTTNTPIESNKPLVKDEDGVDVDVHVYRSMIGSLMYLIASRPDIMFAVCACARFQVTPKASHLNALKRIFRTKHIEIQFHFIRDCYEKRLIEVVKIHTNNNVADHLTKGFDVTRKSMDLRINGSCASQFSHVWIHNIVAFLKKPTESKGFTEAVDFLKGNSLHYALTHNPIVYDSLVKQFWLTATVRTLANGTQQIEASIDNKPYILLWHLSEVNFNWQMQQEQLRFKEPEIPQYPDPTQTFVADEATTTSVEVDAEGATTTTYGLKAGVEDNMKLQELMILVPKLESKIGSLEKELKDTKQTFEKAILTLVDRVKTLEVALKRKSKKVVLSNSEKEETEAHRRKIKESDDDPLVSLRRKESKGKKVDTSLDFEDTGLENISSGFEDISTGFNDDQDVNTGFDGVNTGSLEVNTGQREGKASMIIEETQSPKKTSEQILIEEASLAEAIRLDTLEKEEMAKQVHLDALLAQRIAEEQELTKQQKKRKAQVQFEAQHYTEEYWDVIRANLEANAELTKSMLGSDLPKEDFAKKMVELVNQRKKHFAEERAKARRNDGKASRDKMKSSLSSWYKNWLVHKQTACGKDFSNSLMVDSLPKTIIIKEKTNEDLDNNSLELKIEDN
ncbi:putative ribonuclease H-like domain-containing protein [Tanacetum coccineum]